MANKLQLRGPMEAGFSNPFSENPFHGLVYPPLDGKNFPPPNNNRGQSNWETCHRSGFYKKRNLTQVEEIPSGSAVSHRDEHERFQKVDLGLTSHQLQKLTQFLDQMNLDENGKHTVNRGTVMTTNFKQNDKELLGKSAGTWIVDSGATDHVACSVNMFEEVSKVYGVTVNLPNGEAVCVSHVGTVRLSDRLILRGVLCVPAFHCNLISLGKLTADEMLSVMFVDGLCYIQANKTGERIGTARKERGLYILKVDKGSEVKKRDVRTVCINASSSTSRILDIPPNKDLLWHLRLGHMSQQRMSVVKQIHEDVLLPDSICYVCPHARMKRLSFPLSTSTVDSCFDLIHMDIWGPYRHSTVYGHHYFLTVVDEFSRFTWVFLLKMKAEVRHLIQSFCAYVSTQFQKQVKVIRTDQGAEFRWPEFYDEKGIIHQESCVSTPQQNGVVERKHQHILNVARALKLQANLPIPYWGHCIQHAVKLINLTPTPLLNNSTPFQQLFQKDPDIKHLKVFGCLVFASTLTRDRSKFDTRARTCVNLGVSETCKGYILLDLLTKELFISRDVLFHELVFPFHSPQEQSASIDSVPLPTPCLVSDLAHLDEVDFSSANSPNSEPNSAPNTEPCVPQQEIHEPIILPSDSSDQVTQRASRSRRPPSYLQDYVCASLRQRTSPHTLDSVISCARLSESHSHFVASIDKIPEPQTYNQAVLSSEWQDSMKQEIAALESTKTWELVDLPKGKKPIGCKWVYKVKYNADGSVERFKARLVAKGYTQTAGIDYEETFSPVAKVTTIRCLLALAAAQGWFLHQLDVNNAFLHGDLVEEVYMKPPPGFQTSRPNQVCRLKKSLYGLKQASRQWNQKLTAALQHLGYIQSQHDHSLFIKTVDGHFLIALVYVDDIVLGGNHMPFILELKQHLHHLFRIKDLGELRFFLGLEVSRSSSGIVVSQRKYALSLLETFDMLDCKGANTPMKSKVSLYHGDSELLSDNSVYRSLVGKLLYLTITRPDISFVTQQLSQFLDAPTVHHYHTAQQVLRYIKSAPGKGLFYSAGNSITLSGFADSDWGACKDSRRSITGYCMFIGDALISWKSKKQTTVSRSSTEAEYRALALATCELQWLCYLAADFKMPFATPIPLHCDNTSAVQLAHNPVFHERTKHIEIDCHIVREKIQAGLVKLVPISTLDQLADIFTKPLDGPLFHSLLQCFNMKDIYCSPSPS